MKIINASHEILTPINREFILRHIERVARTCYKSEDAITSTSAPKMVKSLIKRGHLAMLEHASISVRFYVDRGVSHEMVRHRIASYAQESTRYCNYCQDKHGNCMTVIKPFYLEEGTPQYNAWYLACRFSEKAYFDLISKGCTPQEARAVLPHSLKTEVVATMNLRQWIHFFNLRVLGTTGAPHPQMKEVGLPLLREFAECLPEVFGEQYRKAIEDKEE